MTATPAEDEAVRLTPTQRGALGSPLSRNAGAMRARVTSKARG